MTGRVLLTGATGFVGRHAVQPLLDLGYEVHQVLAAVASVSLAWCRVFFLYGPHEAPTRLGPSVVVPLLRGKPVPLGDGRAQRDFMHVQDVASALVAVLDSRHIGPVDIAAGECHAIRNVVMVVARQIGRPDLIRLGARPTPANEPASLSATAGVLHSLDFRPRFTLSAGLVDTVAWWRQAAGGVH